MQSYSSATLTHVCYSHRIVFVIIALQIRQGIGWRDGSRIADNLHTRNFLRLSSSSGRPSVSFTPIPGIYVRVESRLSRSSVLSIRSSRASCISPSSRHIHIHTYIFLSRSSSPRSSLHFYIRVTPTLLFSSNPSSSSVGGSFPRTTNEEASFSTSVFHRLSKSASSNEIIYPVIAFAVCSVAIDISILFVTYKSIKIEFYR